VNTLSQPFADRKQAGRALAESLEPYRGTDCIVLAIPRGGVVTAFEVASAFGWELDVIVPRKLRAPDQPELAIGAIASWGDHERLLDNRSMEMIGVNSEYIEREVSQQLSEIDRRLIAYRGTTDPPNIAGRTVVIVDDGVATGYTTRAAILAARNLKAAKIILAVPVGAPDSIEALRPYVDELICLRTPFPFMAVGYWYADFGQVSDSEVIALLEEARSHRGR
jgi:putative phosphoribosyl transferase